MKFTKSYLVVLLLGILANPAVLMTGRISMPLLAQPIPIIYSEDASHTAVAVEKLLAFHLPKLVDFFQCSLPDDLSIQIVSKIDDWAIYQAGGAPEWAAGLFLPVENLVVLNLTGNATLRKLENVLVHELSHAFYEASFPIGDAPVWLNEGLAEYISGGIFEMNTLLLANVQAAGKLPGLDELENLHAFNRPRAELGYTICLSAVRFLLSELTPGGGWHPFRETLRKSGWTTALSHHLQTDEIGFELDWYAYVKNKYGWQVIFNIENLLWAAAAGLVILAFFWKWWRNRRKLEQWNRLENPQQSNDPS